MCMRRIFGFTLIELLVAIGMMAVLSAGVISVIGTGPQQSARDAKRKSDLNQIASVLEIVRNQSGSYPPCNGSTTTCYTNGIGGTLNLYLNSIPTDPIGGGATANYRYWPRPNNCLGNAASRCTAYTLCASLERDRVDMTAQCGLVSNCSRGTTCSFALENP